MKILMFLIAIFITFSSLGLMAEVNPKEITVGFIPGGNPEQLKKDAEEFAQTLQLELGVPVNIYISKNYSGLAEAMKNKKVDFAFFTSVTFIYAEKNAGAKVLLKKVWEEPFYFSALVAAKKSNIRRIEDLKNKKVVFVDKKSASGYLYPLAQLSKKKIAEKDLAEVKFSGSHSSSVELLQDGKFEVAALFSDDSEGKSGAWIKFAKDVRANKNNFKVIWMSEPIPNDPFTVRQDFYDKYPKFSHSMMVSLIELSEKEHDKLYWKNLMGSRTLMMATSRQYDPVRELVKDLGIKEE